MRRPLFFLFILIVLISFIKTKNYDLYVKEQNVEISGTITLKKEKQRFDEYVINNYLVKDYSKNFDLNVGQVVKINGKLKNLKDLKYDNFDYGRFIKSSGYVGLVEAKSYKIISRNKFYDNLNKVNTYIKETTRYLYKEKSNFINSLILGLKNDLTEEENEMFRKTGTSHIISISGLHIQILSSIVIIFVSKINKIYKLIIFFVVMIFYSLMIGQTPSLIRAIIFMTLSYFSFFVDRKNDLISNLSLAGVFLVVKNPFVIYNVSFQLSFFATLSIIYFYNKLNKIFKNSFLSVTLSSNILTLPLVYYHFNNISLLSLFGNMIVAPFVSVIMFVSILSVLFFNVNLFLSKVFAFINKFLINFIYFGLEKISNLNFLFFEFEETKLHFVIIYYILIFMCMFFYERKIILEEENDLQGYYKKFEI